MGIKCVKPEHTRVACKCSRVPYVFDTLTYIFQLGLNNINLQEFSFLLQQLYSTSDGYMYIYVYKIILMFMYNILFVLFLDK